MGFLCRIRLGTFANFIVFNMMFWRFLKKQPHRHYDRTGNERRKRKFRQIKATRTLRCTELFYGKTLYYSFLFCKILQKKKFYILTYRYLFIIYFCMTTQLQYIDSKILIQSYFMVREGIMKEHKRRRKGVSNCLGF